MDLGLLLVLSAVSISDIAAVLGMIFGTAGLVLGILNHARDRAMVRVVLQWDMRIAGEGGKSWAIISVANVGRRPIFISKAAIRLPKKYERRYLFSHKSLVGKKLSEGDPEITYMCDQTGYEKYAEDWQSIRAVVFDSRAKRYYSKPDVNNIPSWAKGTGTVSVN